MKNLLYKTFLLLDYFVDLMDDFLFGSDIVFYGFTIWIPSIVVSYIILTFQIYRWEGYLISPLALFYRILGVF